MQHPEPVARRLYDLTEPISLVNFFSEEPNEAMAELGFGNYWDGYFAGGAPLGPVPAEVVDAAFSSFADGEVARHIPTVWAYDAPEPDELGQLITSLEPIVRGLQATGSQ
jgi:hypothetical protein